MARFCKTCGGAPPIRFLVSRLGFGKCQREVQFGIPSEPIRDLGRQFHQSSQSCAPMGKLLTVKLYSIWRQPRRDNHSAIAGRPWEISRKVTLSTDNERSFRDTRP